MRANDALVEAYGRIHGLVERAVDGLDAEQLAWRPDPDANSIGWLIWHLIRVQDAQVGDLAGARQRWTEENWAPRFGLPPDYIDTGYGHSSQQVTMIAPADPGLLVEYQQHVAQACAEYLKGLDADELDRVIDHSYDPPVTVGVRLISVVGDALQHAGQAAYVRGLCLRRDHGVG